METITINFENYTNHINLYGKNFYSFANAQLRGTGIYMYIYGACDSVVIKALRY